MLLVSTTGAPFTPHDTAPASPRSHRHLFSGFGFVFVFFKYFSSVSNLLGYPRSLFILLDKLEALRQESDHLDETRAVLCEFRN